VTKPPPKSFDSVDDLFDDDIAQKVQDAEDAYLDLDGKVGELETLNAEPATVGNVS
jgi:hypothetical protein